MVTLTDIAAKLGVSTATVSNALKGKGRINPEKRLLIQKTASDMGYIISNAAVNPEDSIVIITEQASVSFVSEILYGVTRESQHSESVYPIFDMGIFSRGLKKEADGDTLAPVLCKIMDKLPPYTGGIIYISQYPRDIHGLFRDAGMPVLFVFGTGETDQVSINYNDQQGAYLAVSHLAALGRKRIAMLSGPIDSKSMNDRLYGYQCALLDHRMGFDPTLVRIGTWEVDSGYSRTLELLQMPQRPDAVFVQNDTMAIGALHALKEHGARVPQDIAVIGFDDTVLTGATAPELSSIAPPFGQMGESAVRTMRAMIRGEMPETNSLLLPCTLKRRGSA